MSDLFETLGFIYFCNMFQKRIKNPWLVFVLTSALIALPLFFSPVPINLFKGEIVMIQNGKEVKVQAPLSAAYFIGLGYDEKDMKDVKEFHLVNEGYFFVFLMFIGIPGVLAYRVVLSNRNESAEEKSKEI